MDPARLMPFNGELRRPAADTAPIFAFLLNLFHLRIKYGPCVTMSNDFPTYANYQRYLLHVPGLARRSPVFALCSAQTWSGVCVWEEGVDGSDRAG